ncbi:hypothetical protein [Paenibacillus agilis]|uniref:Uncharacterized protein n=1 Tax=Paenibacillus agilis TaxID=3020863 RepID=A0A559IDR0_9BACL|nr:hypothetical protein [Paenibacillus agilis]TVX85593.1 hypothetical protein FPZ44_24880 [Paenibacillus agilis]
MYDKVAAQLMNDMLGIWVIFLLIGVAVKIGSKLLKSKKVESLIDNYARKFGMDDKELNTPEGSLFLILIIGIPVIPVLLGMFMGIVSIGDIVSDLSLF